MTRPEERLEEKPDGASSSGATPSPDDASIDATSPHDRSPDDTAAPGAVAPRRRPARPLVALCLALVALAAGLGGLALAQSRQVRAEQQRHGAEKVAGQMGQALLTYDYAKLEEARARVLSLATGTFKTQYEQAFTGLKVTLAAAKSVSRATVTQVFAADPDGGSVKAIVVLDVTAEGTAGKDRRFGAYIEVDLVRLDGRWKVDGVTNLNFGQTAPVATGPGSTSGTTPPGSGG